MIEHYTERSNKRDHWPAWVVTSGPMNIRFQKLYIRLDTQEFTHAIPLPR